MNTNKKLLKRILCLFFICIIFVSNCIVTAFAVTDEDKFYTNDKDALDDLFKMTVADLYGDVKDPLGWISDGKTFVVIREYLDNDDNTRYKIYVNTPNLPQYLQNLALRTVSDGWEDKTFEPESSLIKEVGQNENNVINKFGFHISVNKYQGEYPRLYMSLSGILPVKWYQKIWRGLKALVGLSFVNAPDKENFKTLNYYNHMYSEVDEDLIEFIQNYWLEYFVGVGEENNGIWSDESTYFRDAEDFKAQLITKDQVEEAENWKEENKDDLKTAHKHYDNYNEWCDKYNTYEGVLANIPEFKNDLDAIQEQIDNATTETDKAKYEKKYQETEKNWESYRDSYAPPMPKYSKKDSELIATELGYDSLLDRFHDFETKWNKGVDKNSKDYKNDGYKFSYAQCLLDIPQDVIDEAGGNDCTKIVDGQSITGSVVEIFVNSGAYKIGLTKESRDKANKGTQADTLQSPVKRKVDKSIITSYFGNRKPPTAGASSGHGGIDIAYSNCGGDPVLAAAGGQVELAGKNYGYGNCVIIKHNDRVKTLYGHLSKISVKKGDMVTGGQEIGKIGSTGISTGNHLHFEVHINGNRADPLDYLDNTITGVGFAEPLEYKDELTRAEAIKLITLLQSKCGPTYKEVMENIVACMIHNAANAGEEIELEQYIDPRVMPYDRDTLIPSGGGGTDVNGETIHIADPRVTIYKSENIIGSFVTTGRVHPEYLLKNKILIRGALSITSIFARWSIFLNQITNFQVLDDIGLSPTNMWTSFSSKVVTAIIMLLLIISIVRLSFKFFKGSASLREVLAKTAFFLGILTLILLLILYPEKTWNNYKTLFNKVNNVGEMTIVNTMDNVGELYGNGQDSSVTYYLTYFNLWTLYNTGYSIADPQQVIDYNDPETEDMEVPTIADAETTLWCVVLADSFNRNGTNSYNLSSTGKNGLNVNPNAYRVVDHFIAPRLYTTGPTDSGGEGSLNMVNTVNENFNGKFQNIDFFTGLGSIVNGFNLLLLAFIKAITFLWMWYMLYILVFNIVLGAIHDPKGLRHVIARALSPILAMAVIGAWVGIVIQISMISEGIINLIINCTLVWLTFRFLSGWKARFALSFPAPLNYLVRLVDRNERDMYLRQKEIDDYKFDHRHEGEVDINNIIDENGNYIGAATDEKAKARYQNAIKEAQGQARNKNGVRNSYDNIEDERLKRKVMQLDNEAGIYGDIGTAKLNMESEIKYHSSMPRGQEDTPTSKTSNNNPNSSKKSYSSTSPQTQSNPNVDVNKSTFNEKQPSRFSGKKIGEGGKTTSKKNKGGKS